MGHLIDHTGKRFGKLLVLHRAEDGPDGRPRWLCQCDCGRQKVIAPLHFTSGRTTGCGCRNIRRNPYTPEWHTWKAMHYRCKSPNATGYERYGGSGIKVCERWNDYETFLADMGKRPTLQHTLDRYPDKFGNYEPGNCRWATKSEQQLNRRDRGHNHGHQTVSV